MDTKKKRTVTQYPILSSAVIDLPDEYDINLEEQSNTNEEDNLPQLSTLEDHDFVSAVHGGEPHKINQRELKIL